MSLFLFGCRRYAAYVYSGVDPNYSPVKSDPIFIVLPNKPSIRERQFLVDLKSELKKNKFNIVENKKKSKWILGLSLKRRILEFGGNTTAVSITPKSAVAETTPNVFERVTIYLYLFDTKDFIEGNLLSIWEGSVSSTEGVFKRYKHSMLKNLLDVFGTNYDRNTRIDKEYGTN